MLQPNFLKIVGVSALSICALVTTTLVVEQRFFSTPQSPRIETAPIFIKNWREFLPIGLRTGPEDAPVQVVEFADFQCPYCARFEATVLSLLRNYPETVAVTIVHYPLAQHSNAIHAGIAAECAAIQGRLDSMKSVLFANFQTAEDFDWVSLADDASVHDLAAFEQCMKDPSFLDQIAQNKALAESIGISATPEVLVNGWLLPTTPTTNDFQTIVKNVKLGVPPVSGLWE